MLVTLPAEQMLQSEVPALSAYSPATQGVQETWPAKSDVSEPAAQSVHAIVESELTVPAEQAVHVVAPVLVNVSVNLPGTQTLQSEVPALPAYSPATQEEQETCPSRLFVSDPAGQSTHATVESELTLPAEQAVHVVAPVLVNVLVKLPGVQAMQSAVPALPAYSPATQGVHAT